MVKVRPENRNPTFIEKNFQPNTKMLFESFDKDGNNFELSKASALVRWEKVGCSIIDSEVFEFTCGQLRGRAG
jgi:hypothetical protein